MCLAGWLTWRLAKKWLMDLAKTRKKVASFSYYTVPCVVRGFYLLWSAKLCGPHLPTNPTKRINFLRPKSRRKERRKFPFLGTQKFHLLPLRRFSATRWANLILRLRHNEPGLSALTHVATCLPGPNNDLVVMPPGQDCKYFEVAAIK